MVQGRQARPESAPVHQNGDRGHLESSAALYAALEGPRGMEEAPLYHTRDAKKRRGPTFDPAGVLFQRSFITGPGGNGQGDASRQNQPSLPRFTTITIAQGPAGPSIQLYRP